MIAGAIILNVVLGPSFFGLPPSQDVAAITARYTKECPGSATPACRRMRYQLEAALYAMLRRNGAAFDGEILDVALNAEMPQLQAYALIRMAQLKPFPKEHLARVAALVDSPYWMVRNQAVTVLAEQDSRYRRWYDERNGTPSGLTAFPDADGVPDARRLGAPLYKNARYRPYASSRLHEWFTTEDPPDRVIAFYATGGRTARTADELSESREARRESMIDPATVMEMMMKAQAEGKTPEEIQAMLLGTAAGSRNVNLEAFQKDGMISPKFIEIDNKSQRMLAVFHDEVLNATALVFVVPDRAAEARAAYMATLSPEQQEEETLRELERHKVLGANTIIEPIRKP
jgi:hypothetical protein